MQGIDSMIQSNIYGSRLPDAKKPAEGTRVLVTITFLLHEFKRKYYLALESVSVKEESISWDTGNY